MLILIFEILLCLIMQWYLTKTPESPKYLLTQGRMNEMYTALEYISKVNEAREKDIKIIHQESDSIGSVSLWTALKGTKYL